MSFNAEPRRPARGKCHVCGQTGDIDYCSLCDHWFCRDCKTRIAERVWAAILEKLGGRTPGCCGPVE